MKFPTQLARHATRLAVLLFIIAVPCLANYRIFLTERQVESIRALEDPSLARSIVLTIDRLTGNANRDEKLAALGTLRGNHWSADIGGLSLTDPLAATESLAAGKKFHRALLLGALLPVLATLLLGRFFCSWICPAGFLFDLADRLRSRLHRTRVRLHDTTLWRGNKYALLFTGLLLAALTSIPLLGFFYPPALLGREIHAVMDALFAGLSDNPARSLALPLTAASLFLFLIVIVETFFSRRAWCRYLCPGGALYTILGAPRLVRVHNDRARCTQCTECIQACPMALNPMTRDTPGPECDQCLLCLPACEPRSLSLELGLPRLHRKETAN